MWRGTIALPAIERVQSGIPAAEALLAEAERLDARRVFLVVSRTMNRETGHVAALRDALGARFAGLHEGIPPHTPMDVVVAAAAAARAVDADLLATFGGGSVTDAGKVMQLCLRHGITAMEQLEPFRMVTNPDGTRHLPEYDGPVVRQIAIPTTLSGGEYNSQAGCTNPLKKVKQSFRPRAACAARHHPRPCADGRHADVGVAGERHPGGGPRDGRAVLAAQQSCERCERTAGTSPAVARVAAGEGRSGRSCGAAGMPACRVAVRRRALGWGADGGKPRDRPCARGVPRACRTATPPASCCRMCCATTRRRTRIAKRWWRRRSAGRACRRRMRWPNWSPHSAYPRGCRRWA
jgi:hypothetical protein